ncbi:MAG: transposase [Candidatus Brocadiia bacterium]
MVESNVLRRNGKRIVIGLGDRVYVGLDVHKKNINVVVWRDRRKVAEWLSPSSPRALVASLKPLGAAAEKAVYEAGPCGFELYQPERFEVHRQVSTMVGLVPRFASSGERHTDEGLIKAGRESLRSMLVDAAWRWVGLENAASKTFARLVGNTGCKQKVIVGMARKLCVNLWCMRTRGERYRPGG